MENTGYLSQFLYLLVYSSSLVSSAAVAVFRKRLNASADKPLKQLIMSVAVCSTLLSAQVFLNAIDLLNRLNKPNASRVTIVINILVIGSIALIVYSGVALTHALRSSSYSRIILRTTAALTAILLLCSAILQILTLFAYSQSAAEMLGILLISGMALSSAGLIYSAVRLVIPFSLPDDPNSLHQVRILLFCLFILPALFILSGNTIGTILAPIGFTGLNILCIRILHSRLNIQNSSAGLPAEKNAGPNPAGACRELGLSKRESDVALLLSQGRSYKEIAAELFISMSTTQTHVGRIYSKLRINNKTELSNMLNYREN